MSSFLPRIKLNGFVQFFELDEGAYKSSHFSINLKYSKERSFHYFIISVVENISNYFQA